MTVREKYDSIGENYDDVLGRLMKEERIERFTKSYFITGDYEELEKNVKARDVPNTFEFSHRMKGNSLNIGFSKFAAVVDTLCNYVRHNDVTDFDKMDELFEEVSVEYQKLKELFA